MSADYRYDVFISHSHRDKAIVRRIVDRLESEGLTVWLDERQIKLGEDWFSKLHFGIAQSRKVLLCLSANTRDSEWVDTELSLVLSGDPANKEKRLIPLKLDDTELPLPLQRFQALHWQGAGKEEFQLLLDALSEGTSEPALPDPTPPAPESTPSRTRRSNLPVYFTATLLGIIGAALAISSYLLPDSWLGRQIHPEFRDSTTIEEDEGARDTTPLTNPAYQQSSDSSNQVHMSPIRERKSPKYIPNVVSSDEGFSLESPPGTKPFAGLVASADSIELGDSVSLTWMAREADSVFFRPSIGVAVEESGTAILSPTHDTKYTAIAVNSSGDTDSVSVLVKVRDTEAPVLSLEGLSYETATDSTEESIRMWGTVADRSPFIVTINDESADIVGPNWSAVSAVQPQHQRFLILCKDEAGNNTRLDTTFMIYPGLSRVGGREVVYVSDMVELYREVASDRVVVLRPGCYDMNNLHVYSTGEKVAPSGFADMLDGKSDLLITGPIDLSARLYLHNNEKGLEVDSCDRLELSYLDIGYSNDSGNVTRMMDFRHCNQLSVRECRIHGNSKMGVWLQGCKNTIFDKTRITEIGSPLLAWQCDSVLLLNCELSSIRGRSMDKLIRANAETRIWLRHCVLSDTCLQTKTPLFHLASEATVRMDSCVVRKDQSVPLANDTTSVTVVGGEIRQSIVPEVDSASG